MRTRSLAVPAALLAVAAVAASVVPGCLSAHPRDGALACDGDGRCPRGYYCAADRTCWATGDAPDLAVAPEPTPDLAVVDAASARPPSLCAGDGGFVYCTGFEGSAVDAPAYPLTNNAVLAFDGTRAFRGHGSLEVSAIQSSISAIQGEIGLNQSFPPSGLYARLFVYLPSPPTSIAMRVSAMFQLANGYQGLQLNLVPTANGYVPSVYNGVAGVQHDGTLPLALDGWSCLEWMVAPGAPGQLRLWVNDVEDGAIAASENTMLNPPLAALSFGVVHGPNQPAHDVWLDEIAVDVQRIGCAR